MLHRPQRAPLDTSAWCIKSCALCMFSLSALLFLWTVQTVLVTIQLLPTVIHSVSAAIHRFPAVIQAFPRFASLNAAAWLAPEAYLYYSARESFCFFFSTGRSASQHISRLFVSGQPPLQPAYITHQEEHPTISTRTFVNQHYRKLASIEGEAEFARQAQAFLMHEKVPFYRQLLAQHSAKRLVYTGHLPLVFGLGPFLVDRLSPGKMRVVRLRRDRVATALSLMALGPEEEDPWADQVNLDAAPPLKRRWFPTPESIITRLRVTPNNFRTMNRFQRWLWYVDDVECRWQALRVTEGHRFGWIEESLEALAAMDGGLGWKKIADFCGVDIAPSRLYVPDNTIQHKAREKLNVSEQILRDWDARYKELVGPCDLCGDGSLLYTWDSPFPSRRCH